MLVQLQPLQWVVTKPAFLPVSERSVVFHFHSASHPQAVSRNVRLFQTCLKFANLSQSYGSKDICKNGLSACLHKEIRK